MFVSRFSVHPPIVSLYEELTYHLSKIGTMTMVFVIFVCSHEIHDSPYMEW